MTQTLTEKQKISGARTRARAFFLANPGAIMSPEDFQQQFGFSSPECAKQGVYCLNGEGVLESVRVIRSCDWTQQQPDRKTFQDELACLSWKQVEVLIWLAKGLNAAQVAQHMNINKHSVDTHRQRLLKKLGCTLPEAVVTATKAGYV